MPISDNMNVPYISTVVGALSPMSALDIGIGMGKFAYILREKCEWTAWVEDVNCVKKENQRIRIDGIEVCPEYITPLQEFLYDKIHIGLAQDIIPTLGDFDLINMGDVSEHFDKSQGRHR